MADLAAHYELAYEEAKRAVALQQRHVDRLQSASGILIAAAAITTSFFGTGALARGDVGVTGWTALACFGVIGVAVLIVLWPGHRWLFTANPRSFVVAYIEHPAGALDVPAIHRDLVAYMARRYIANARRLDTLTLVFTVCAELLVCEVMAWVAGILDGT